MIKTSLMDGKNHPLAVSNDGNYITFHHATIAYFALLFRIVKGWAVSEAFKSESVQSSNSFLIYESAF